MNELLAKYETLSASQEILEQYLGKARELLRSFPGSNGRSGLLGLTDYLARQSEALGVCA
jgi:geranylgeranyl pyrophosphate synthase